MDSPEIHRATEQVSLVETFQDLAEELDFPMIQTAHEWLQTIGGKTVGTQLRARRITTVKSVVWPGSAYGYLNMDPQGNFIVTLNTSYEPDEIAITLGHELAHTFSFDLTATFPTGLLPAHLQARFHSSHLEEGSTYQKIERFCDAFGLQWLATGNNRQQVLEGLEIVGDVSKTTRMKTGYLMETSI